MLFKFCFPCILCVKYKKKPFINYSKYYATVAKIQYKKCFNDV